ncbi:hypothetical protein H4219_003751 [Mycoemilia scoparia]|uniref:Trafficking protein particle complex subunit 13 n=1 Tax=Mycoemilia scoparia TaxID=417184 RepID=A0A9W8DSG6_9FUNG|nr:hypothetical protein H4219_003751 [Mycoemilia scoparia]
MYRHPLTLKVMRLARPTFSQSMVFPVDYVTDQPSTFSQSVQQLLETSPALFGNITSTSVMDSDTPYESFVYTEALSVPRKFGAMYLGETFGAHVCITNSDQEVVKNIAIQASIEAGGRKSPLDLELRSNGYEYRQDQSSHIVIQKLEPGESVNIQIFHETRQLGVHDLEWQVDYLRGNGEPDTLRKLFNFRVNNPLIVKTKVNNIQWPSNRTENDTAKRGGASAIFLEIQVTNATEDTMVLERLRFDPVSVYDIAEFDRIPTTDNPLPPQHFGHRDTSKDDQGLVEENSSLWHGDSFLHHNQVRQYLYMLIPKPSLMNAPSKQDYLDALRKTQMTKSLGKLDIVWRSQFGAMGRLQTSQLARKPPSLFPLSIECKKIIVSKHSVAQERQSQLGSNNVLLEEPFKVQCRAYNLSDTTTDVAVFVDSTKLGTVLLCGATKYSLGPIESGESREFSMTFIPMSLGIHRVGGLRITNLLTGASQDVDHLADVVVSQGDMEQK